MQYTGFTLLEILISLFIFSLALLGLDAMQLTTLRQAKTTYYLSVTSVQLNAMAERLAATKGQQLLESQQHWNEHNKEVLPNGRGTIRGEYPHVNLSLFWGAAREDACVKDKLGQAGCLHLDL